MRKIYLVQVLLHTKDELQNYSYYENMEDAIKVAADLKKDSLIHADYVRIKKVTLIN